MDGPQAKLWNEVGLLVILNSVAFLSLNVREAVQFWWKLAGLAVLFNRQILNGFQIFFIHSILILISIIETHARTFFDTSNGTSESVFQLNGLDL